MKVKKIIFILLLFTIVITSLNAEDKIKFFKKHGRVYVTLDVINYPIKDLLKMIAEKKKMDLIFSTSVSGTFTGRFTNVPVEVLMRKILKSNNLDYEKLGGIYRIDTAANIERYRAQQKIIMENQNATQDLVTRIIRINYADIGDIANNVKKILSKRGSIEIDRRTKKLIITDIPSKFPLIYKFIASIDRPVKQVLIKVKFVELNHDDLKHIEFYWTMDNQNTNKSTTASGGSYTGTNAQAASSGAGLFHIGIVKNTFELDAVLNMLANENKAVIRSHPQILAMNNEPATINIGNKIPLRMVDESGKLTTKLTYVGTQIKVTPQITPDNKIILKIHPEVSSIAGQFGNGVLINTNQVDTEVILKDRETAVIGGMIKDETTINNSGVPILSKIPILGALFRTKEKSKNKQEILIFVTPYIQQEGSNE